MLDDIAILTAAEVITEELGSSSSTRSSSSSAGHARLSSDKARPRSSPATAIKGRIKQITSEIENTVVVIVRIRCFFLFSSCPKGAASSCHRGRARLAGAERLS
jgi:hypothetical protein